MRKINSDSLGRIGEGRFRELCAAAGLYCSKSDPDRAGWDFIVEFPVDRPSKGQLLDRRPRPVEFRAQVKTVWSGNKRISIFLSAAENLARFLCPTFIFIFVVDDHHDVSSVYVIHVIDKILERILKNIRLCQAKGITELNSTSITFDYAKTGRKITPTGSDIKEYIELCEGGNRTLYGDKKNMQIRNLGFADSPISGAMSLLCENEEELAEIFLGLRRGRVKSLAATETRWGISLPIHQAEEGEGIEFSQIPHPGIINIVQREGDEKISLPVHMTRYPFLIKEKDSYLKIRLMTGSIEIFIHGRHPEYSFSVRRLIKHRMTLSELLESNRVLSVLGTGTAKVELRVDSGRLLQFNLENFATEFDGKWLSFEPEVLISLRRIVDFGGGGEISPSHEQISSQFEAIKFLDDIISNPGELRFGRVKMEMSNDIREHISSSNGLFFSRLGFEEAAIGFCALTNLEISGTDTIKNIELTKLKAYEVRLIGLSEREFEIFIAEMTMDTGISTSIRVDAASIFISDDGSEDI